MNNKPGFKLIPYGVSSFNLFATRNYYYVDKTHYLKNLEEKGRYLFFIRPRRFGKSLFLSKMEMYYDIKQKENFDSLFNGTYIQQNPTPEKNSYLILKFDFSQVDAEFSMIEETFLERIKMDALFFLNHYQEYLKIDLPEVLQYIQSLPKASMVLAQIINYCKIAGQKLYVIIDEYDNFANTILAQRGEQGFIDITHGEGFYRAFFNVLKGGTSGAYAPISRLFISGVSPITLDDLTSGFNIATNISLDIDVNEMLGFTHQEVETLIEYYRQTGKILHSTPELMQLMSCWYNHYRFSRRAKTEVFNSVQVLYFLREYLIESRIPDSLIDSNILIDYNKIRHLIILDQKNNTKPNGNFSKLKEIVENHAIHTDIKNRFPISHLTYPENFISLLYYLGLLTIAGIDDEDTPILIIPNETIKRLYYDYIKDTYDETGLFSLDLEKYLGLMKDMAYRGAWQPMMEYLAIRMDQCTGLRDYITGEKMVQTFLNVYLGLASFYNVDTERELNKGFADLVLEPILIKFPALKYSYLIELKYLKASQGGGELTQELSESFKNLRLEAETQLNQYAQDEKLQKNIGSTTLIKLVLIFCGHRLVFSQAV